MVKSVFKKLKDSKANSKGDDLTVACNAMLLGYSHLLKIDSSDLTFTGSKQDFYVYNLTEKMGTPALFKGDHDKHTLQLVVTPQQAANLAKDLDDFKSSDKNDVFHFHSINLDVVDINKIVLVVSNPVAGYNFQTIDRIKGSKDEHPRHAKMNIHRQEDDSLSHTKTHHSECTPDPYFPPVNHVPVFNSLVLSTYNEKSPVSISAKATDVDKSDVLTYALIGGSIGDASIDNSGLIT